MAFFGLLSDEEDPTGISPAQRAQAGFGGLVNLGAGLLGFGQDTRNPAPLLAGAQGFTNSIGSLNEIASQNARRKLMGAAQAKEEVQTQKEKAALIQQQELEKMIADPEFQKRFATLPDQHRAVVQMALQTRDPKTIMAAIKDLEPRPFGTGGDIYEPTSGMVRNPMMGTSYQLAGGNAAPGGVQPVQGGGAQPGTALTGDDYLKTLAPGFANTIRGMAKGEIPMPNGQALRSQYGQAVMTALGQYEGGFEGTRFNERNQFAKQVTSGPLFQNTVAPSNKFLNHAAAYLDDYDKLEMDGGPVSYITNPLKYAKMKAERSGLIDSAQVNLQGVKDEFAKFMAGKGQLTDLARKMENDLSVTKSPEETYAVIRKMAELMHGQLSPVEETKLQVMGKAMPESLIKPSGQKALERIAAGPSSQAAPQKGESQQAPQAGRTVGTTADGREIYIDAQGQQRIRGR